MSARAGAQARHGGTRLPPGRGGPANPAAAEPTQPLARAVFALLVLASIGAFFLTQRLKHEPTVVQRFDVSSSFDPLATGPRRHEAISFSTSHSEPVTVRITSVSGEVVATLLRDYSVVRYDPVLLRWDGRRGTTRRFAHETSPHGHPIIVALSPGRLASAGEYRVEVELESLARTVRSPDSFTLLR